MSKAMAAPHAVAVAQALVSHGQQNVDGLARGGLDSANGRLNEFAAGAAIGSPERG